MINLRKKDRIIISGIAKKYLIKGTELRVYGSRVKNTAIDTSDLDLVIFTPEGKMNDLVEFQEALRDSNIPIFVQVFDWYFFPQNFKDNFQQRNESLLIV